MVGLLSQTSNLFLPDLPVGLPPLHLPELTVVHLVALNHDLLLVLRHVGSLDDQVDVGLLPQLQVVDVRDVLTLKVDADDSLLPTEQVGLDAVTAGRVAEQGEDSQQAQSSEFSIHFTTRNYYCQKEYRINYNYQLL